MQKGTFVRINYVGKIKETGEAFDEGKNIPIIIGEGFVIKGLDEELEKMEVGEKKTVEIPPEKAFGERDPKLVKLIPLSEFRKNNTSPYPGMLIRADNFYGRVLSVESGRVKVDFNHPLAGKVLEYDVEITEEIKDAESKVKALFEFFTGIKDTEVKISENSVEIKVKQQVPEPFKQRFSNAVKEYLKFKEVVISEVF